MAFLKIKTLVITGTSSAVLIGGLLFFFREQSVCRLLTIEGICQTRTELRFRVHAEDGEPIEDAEITIDVAGEDPIEEITDSKGFAKANIPVKQEVSFTIYKKGLGRKSLTVNSESSGTVQEVILGSADESPKEQPGEDITEGDQAKDDLAEKDPLKLSNGRVDVGFLIKDVDGKAIKDTEIEFVIDGEAPIIESTNTDGYIEINLKPSDSVDVDIQKEGYERLNRTVNISNPEKIVKVNLRALDSKDSTAKAPDIDTIDIQQFKNPRGYLERTRSCVECDLVGANLSKLDLMRVDLRGARLINANLSNSNLTEANLKNAVLTNARVQSANLTGADLSGSNLNSANFQWSDLAEANLNGANVGNTNFSGTNFCGAIRADGTEGKC